MFIRKILIAAATASLILASAASKADQYDEQVKENLFAQTQGLIMQGYVMDGGSIDMDLKEGQYAEFKIPLKGGREYVFFGACDNDCGDMDMVLYDARSNDVASDYEPDAHPILQLTPDSSATYSLRLRMEDCDSEPCSVGFSLWHMFDGEHDPDSFDPMDLLQ